MKRLAFLLTLIIATQLMLSGCSLLRFLRNPDDVNVIELANNMLKAQQNEFGEPIKVNVPIRVNYTISEKAQVDKELLIEFEIIAETALPVLRFGLNTSEGLELESHDIDELYEGLKAREIIKAEAFVTPLRENKFYLNVYIISEVGEEKFAKLIKVPVAVGAYSLTDEPEIIK